MPTRREVILAENGHRIGIGVWRSVKNKPYVVHVLTAETDRQLVGILLGHELLRSITQRIRNVERRLDREVDRVTPQVERPVIIGEGMSTEPIQIQHVP